MENIEEKKLKDDVNKFAQGLKNEFENFGDEGEKTTEKNENNNENNANFKPFIVPDFVLNYLQDKPIWLQKQIICKNLSPDQIIEVEAIFKPSPDEIVIARQLIKKYIEKLVQQMPEIEKYISDEAVFLTSWSISFVERKRLVKGYVESKQVEQ